jgi:hypothetical protein
MAARERSDTMSGWKGRRNVAAAMFLLLLAAALHAQDKRKYVPRGEPKKEAAKSAAAPTDEVGTRLNIYHDKKCDPYVPAGVMPDGEGVAQNQEFKEEGSDRYCYRAVYNLKDNPWVGVSFLLDGSWTPKRRFDVFSDIGAKKGDKVVARVRARSPDGATARFKVGGGNGDSLAFARQSPWKKLGEKSQLIEIDLTNCDLSGLRVGLCWVMERARQPKGKEEVALIIEEAYIVKLRR